MTITGLLIAACGFLLISVVSIPVITRLLWNYKSSGQKLTELDNYKWWVFATIATGVFMSVCGHGSILIALPSIAGHFGASLETVLWIAISETLAISSLLLPMGRVSDILGRKQVYITGFTIFILASAAAGMAGSLAVLLVARVIQGVSSAMVQANGQAMVLSVFPGSERGKALGSQFSVVGVGSMSGMALGGILVNTLGWRSVFLVNVPVGILVLAVAFIVLEGSRFSQDRQGGGRPPFDWIGSTLSATALLTILLAMTLGNRIGWISPGVMSCVLAFVVSITGFIWWELRTPSPMLDLRLFQRKLVALGITAGWLSFLGSSGVRFLMALYLQSALGFSPRDAGLITLPMAVTMTIMGPIAGRLSDRYGWLMLNVGGLTLASAALFMLGGVVGVNTSINMIIPLLVLQSLGTGLFGSPNNSSIVSAVERSRYGIVSALTSLTRNSANIVSNAMVTAIVVATMAAMGAESSLEHVAREPEAFVEGVRRAFFIAGVMCSIGIVISYLKGDRPKVVAETLAQAPARTGAPD